MTLLLFNNAKTIYSDKPEHFPILPERATKFLLDPQKKPETTSRDGLTLAKWTPGEELTPAEREKLQKAAPRPAAEPSAYWVEIVDEQVKMKDTEGKDTGEIQAIKVGRVRYLIGGDLPNRKTQEDKGKAYPILWAVAPGFPGKTPPILGEDAARLAILGEQSIMGQPQKRQPEYGSAE